ncbi:uncharacterized protein PG998_008587 [Apiospora kogelbergensis]|uniref:uncharacterized protein n=1 Tax=Apiospora kogelbergensis TaxID=1337665 RepID=UPI00312DF207
MTSNNVLPFSAAAFAGHTAQMASQAIPHTCPRPECGGVFTSAADLYQHQYRKSHWRCVKCDINYYDGHSLKLHNAERHVPEAELKCPGCKSIFKLPTNLMKHIEINQCPVIKPHMINEARKRRVDFANGLGSMNPANDNSLFRETIKEDMGDDDDLLLTRQPETPKNEPDPYPQDINKVPDLLTGDNLAALDRAFDENDAGPWASKEEIQALPVIQPTHKHFAIPVDPTKEGYNAAAFWEPYFEKYKCPHIRCGKKFERASALTSHLKGPSHRPGIQISCPYCAKTFAGMADAIAHAEKTNKCRIRDSDLFREFVANVSGGLIDVFMTQPEGIAIHVPTYVVPPNILAELLPGLRAKSQAHGKAVTPGLVSPKSEARQSSPGRRDDRW